MTQSPVKKTLEELKASEQALNQVLSTNTLLSTAVDRSQTIDKVKQLMRHPNWHMQMVGVFNAVISEEPLSENLTTEVSLDLDSILSHPAAHVTPNQTYSSSNQAVSEANPLIVINEALMPHGYGLITSSNPELPEALRFVECFLDNGLIRFDCAHIFSATLSPHIVVSQEKTTRYLSAPLEVVRSKHMFEQEYFWQEPENSNLSVSIKLLLKKK